MKNDFDEGGMGLPDEEMTGGSDLHDLDTGAEGEIELDLEGGERTGRPGGGARTHAPSSPRKSSASGQKTAAKKSAAPKTAAKKSSAPKAAKKSRGSNRKKASGKKTARTRKGSKKAARKGGKKKKGGRR
jgi:hypothetical protein